MAADPVALTPTTRLAYRVLMLDFDPDRAGDRRWPRALEPGGHVIIATHMGDGDIERTEAYCGVPVSWTPTSGSPSNSRPSSPT